MAHLTARTSALTTLSLAALIALALCPSATAARRGTETFPGACDMSGTVRHEPALTMAPTPTEIHGRFSGTCSGTLTDADGQTRQLDGAPARYEVRDAGGELSCNGGTATGTGSLIFGGGHAIEFTLTERRPAPGVAIVALEGAAGGTATVVGTVSPDEDIVGLSERCGGSGVRVIHGDARIASPGISG